jgi:hypothetical protein
MIIEYFEKHIRHTIDDWLFSFVIFYVKFSDICFIDFLSIAGFDIAKLPPETETSQKMSDSTRLDSIGVWLDSARLDMYLIKTGLDSTRLDWGLTRLDSTRLDFYKEWLKV